MTLRLNSSEYIGDTYELKNQKDNKNNAYNLYDTSASRKISNATLKQLHFLGGKMSYSLLSLQGIDSKLNQFRANIVSADKFANLHFPILILLNGNIRISIYHLGLNSRDKC